jgi:hypothetical protein
MATKGFPVPEKKRSNLGSNRAFTAAVPASVEGRKKGLFVV